MIKLLRNTIEVWGPIEHCSGPQNLQACQFSAKSNRGGFPYSPSAMSFNKFMKLLLMI
jgi:hypothetical protein